MTLQAIRIPRHVQDATPSLDEGQLIKLAHFLQLVDYELLARPTFSWLDEQSYLQLVDMLRRRITKIYDLV